MCKPDPSWPFEPMFHLVFVYEAASVEQMLLGMRRQFLNVVTKDGIFSMIVTGHRGSGGRHHRNVFLRKTCF